MQSNLRLQNVSQSHRIQASIIGTGTCVPDRVVTNDDLAKLMTTSDAWIQQRSGIRERRHVVDGEAPSDLALNASKKALEMARMAPGDIDLILVATLSPEHYFPGTSVFLQRKLGLDTTPCLDLRAQCTGFIYGLSVAQAMIVSGQYRRVLLVGVEVHSRGLDFTDRGRDTAVLFGDGAGAVILEASQVPERGVLNVVLRAQGEHAEKLWVEFPTMAHSPNCSADAIAEGGLYPRMDGKFVFKHAVARLPQIVQECLLPWSLTVQDIDLFLFHQANLRINEFVAGALGVSLDRCPSNIDRYGNCSAASIPMLMDECLRNGKIRSGDLVCLAGFGSGFTWGGALVRF
jgi:3-oxoacyl-[acyl-carrier-protein] synthase-3